MASTALVTVVSGDAYQRYAEQMFESAEGYFKPTERVEFIILQGRDGWPEATLYRHHALLADLPASDYIYLIDADMEFRGFVGNEILPDGFPGVTATLHPGYIGQPSLLLPFEPRSESAAYVPPERRRAYFCGGFIGGSREAYRQLALRITAGIDQDDADGILAVWHDESHLNRHLCDLVPATVLSPAYCHPDNSGYYEQAVWEQSYERKIVALDKTSQERGDR